MRLMLYIVALSVCTNAAYAEELIGNAYSNKTSQYLYQERHILGEQQMRSFYTDADGEQIGERLVTYEQDRVKSYRFEQPSLSLMEQVVRNDNKISITARAGEKARQAELNPDKIADVVIDAGFSNFIVRNWDALNQGKRVKLDFVSTARLDVVKLQLKKVNSPDALAASTGITMFEMNIANSGAAPAVKTRKSRLLHRYQTIGRLPRRVQT